MKKVNMEKLDEFLESVEKNRREKICELICSIYYDDAITYGEDEDKIDMTDHGVYNALCSYYKHKNFWGLADIAKALNHDSELNKYRKWCPNDICEYTGHEGYWENIIDTIV